MASENNESHELTPPIPPSSSPRRWWWLLGKKSTLAAALIGTGIVIISSLKGPLLLRAKPPNGMRSSTDGLNLKHQNIISGETGRSTDDSIRIPLKEVVRFKEKQWFVEEIEAAREGDANAMLRLAKMYLHGQGCEKNIPMAQEWLRKARFLGVYSTLEELYAGDDWQEEKAKAAAAARRAAQRAAAMQSSTKKSF